MTDFISFNFEEAALFGQPLQNSIWLILANEISGYFITNGRATAKGEGG